MVGVTYHEDKPRVQAAYPAANRRQALSNICGKAWKQMTQPTPEHIESLLTQYDFNGTVCHIDAFGNGHINDTFRIVVAMPDGRPPCGFYSVSTPRYSRMSPH